MSGTILFLCTGNYYRSRYAEMLFNALSEREGAGWRAESRGLALDPERNRGPISPFALDRAAASGIPVDAPIADPAELTVEDLEQADLIVALHGREHRPMIASRFPEWTSRVEYWSIGDLPEERSESALSRIEAAVAALLDHVAEAVA